MMRVFWLLLILIAIGSFVWKIEQANHPDRVRKVKELVDTYSKPKSWNLKVGFGEKKKLEPEMGDLYIEDELEVDGDIHIGDGSKIYFGNSDDYYIGYNPGTDQLIMEKTK